MKWAFLLTICLLACSAFAQSSAGGYPPGAISYKAGNAASPDTVPAGWLFANGQAVSRATYKALFQAIGTTYGTGDGSTTFNVPDCNGRVLAGRDNQGGLDRARLTAPLNGDTIGNSGGAQTDAYQVSVSAHSLTVPKHYHGVGTLAAGSTGSTHTHTIPGSMYVNGSSGYDWGGNASWLYFLTATSSTTHINHTFSGLFGSGSDGDAGFAAGITNNHSVTSQNLSTLQPVLIVNCLVKY
jgi:microcystin-dependent protein